MLRFLLTLRDNLKDLHLLSSLVTRKQRKLVMRLTDSISKEELLESTSQEMLQHLDLLMEEAILEGVVVEVGELDVTQLSLSVTLVSILLKNHSVAISLNMDQLLM
jgi:hypothetical protein